MAIADILDYNLMMKYEDNFHEYARSHLNSNNYLKGYEWKKIPVQEIYCFLGFIPKMSIGDGKLEGYTAYFKEPCPLFFHQVTL